MQETQAHIVGAQNMTHCGTASGLDDACCGLVVLTEDQRDISSQQHVPQRYSRKPFDSHTMIGRDQLRLWGGMADRRLTLADRR